MNISWVWPQYHQCLTHLDTQGWLSQLPCSEQVDLADTNGDSVSSDGAGALMDRMFRVYICIPWWLYLLLTTPNELTPPHSCTAECDLEESECSKFWGVTCIIVIHLRRAHISAYICGSIPPPYRRQQHMSYKISDESFCFVSASTVPLFKNRG